MIDHPKCRLQNPEAREFPIDCDDDDLNGWWAAVINSALVSARQQYEAALEKGISREVARAILPEGVTATRMYMSGTFRSWIHYLQLRMSADTQAEHRAVACSIAEILSTVAPFVSECAIQKTGQNP
jgi:thymidylate synthase (FAD)